MRLYATLRTSQNIILPCTSSYQVVRIHFENAQNLKKAQLLSVKKPNELNIMNALVFVAFVKIFCT